MASVFPESLTPDERQTRQKAREASVYHSFGTSLEDLFYKLPGDAEIEDYANKSLKDSAKAQLHARTRELAEVEEELRRHQDARTYASGDPKLVDQDFDRVVTKRAALVADVAQQKAVAAKGLDAFDPDRRRVEIAHAEYALVTQAMLKSEDENVRSRAGTLHSKIDVVRMKDSVQDSFNQAVNELDELTKKQAQVEIAEERQKHAFAQTEAATEELEIKPMPVPSQSASLSI